VHGYQTSITTLRRTGRDPLKSGEWVNLYYLVGVDRNGGYERNKWIKEMPAFPDLWAVREAL